MTKINKEPRLVEANLQNLQDEGTKASSLSLPFQKDSISSAQDNDPYAFDLKASFKAYSPQVRTGTDSGCRQTDSGCYQTQSGCRQTDSGCYQTQNGC